MRKWMRAGMAVLAVGLTSPGRAADDTPPAAIPWITPAVQAPRLEFHTFDSSAAQSRVSYHIYTPPAYDIDKGRRFPVLYWLHGSGGGLPGIAKLTGRFDAAIASNRVPPMLVVFVNGLVNGMYCDWKDGTVPLETVIVGELVPHIDATFRTLASRDGRIVEGFSMGGYGAARLGFKYRDLFGSVSILAGGPLQPDFKDTPRAGPRQREEILRKVYGSDEDYYREMSPWRLAERHADALRSGTRIRQAVGDRDETFDNNRKFHEHLEQLGIPHAFTALPGIGHNTEAVLDAMGDAYWSFHREAFAGPTAPPAPAAPVVSTAAGRVSGLAQDGVLAFKGIPFAAPPVGDLRWRPPQPPGPWDGVRACTNFAAACPQPADLTYGFSYKPQSEDCLYLNVWTAATNGPPRPVMVWIHGGGNVIGGAGSPVYDGRHFAESGVVLVSIQYRLGAFGYLAHPALTAEAKALDDRAASGNYGLMDQIAALKWVRNNIAAFGGDTNRVTIFGESAGAANVTHLMSSPPAKGLFHRAIAQSGYFGETTPHLVENRGVIAKSAHSTGLRYGQALGVDGDGADALKALRALPPDKLLSVPFAIGTIRSFSAADDESRGDRRPFRLGPVVDGYVLPEEPGAVWAAGRMHNVPFMAGSLLDDGSVFSRAIPVKRLPGYQLVLRMVFGEDADRAQNVFPAATDDDVPAAVKRITTIISFRAPARRLVRWVDAAGGDAWLYHFSRNPRSGRATREGVFHGLEIGYAFKSLSLLGGDVDKAVADDMHRRWINFATTGNPNRGADGTRPMEPAWPTYKKDTDRHLEFGDRVTAGERLDRDACDLADRVSARKRDGGPAAATPMKTESVEKKP